MDIQDVRIHLEALEELIAAALQEFTNVTTVSVDSIRLQQFPEEGVYGVYVEATI